METGCCALLETPQKLTFPVVAAEKRDFLPIHFPRLLGALSEHEGGSARGKYIQHGANRSPL